MQPLWSLFEKRGRNAKLIDWRYMEVGRQAFPERYLNARRAAKRSTEKPRRIKSKLASRRTKKLSDGLTLDNGLRRTLVTLLILSSTFFHQLFLRHRTLSQLLLRSGRFFVDVANLWEVRVANVLTAIPLKLTSQRKIASCDVLPLRPDFRVALQLRFGPKHRGQPCAFGSRSHAIPQPTSLPARQTEQQDNLFLNKRSQLALDKVLN
jgi:hypothetical protein